MNQKQPFLKINLSFLLFLFLPFNVIGLCYEYFAPHYLSSIHVLIVNPNEHAIIPVRASGNNTTRETVATLSNRYGALAGINGGFWKIDGNPAGILKINHHWYGTSDKPRGAIGWSLKNQKVLIDRLLTNKQLNRSLNEEEIEVIPMSTPPQTTSEEWKELEYIVGGTPVLINYGQLVEDYYSEQIIESFVIKKHPRTAVGIRNTGEWVFVVVDGRFYGFLGGMTIKELAEFMLELGCIKALNLDGGGSSTMVLAGEVINESCGKSLENGKRVEAVSDAILIFPLHQIPKMDF